MGAICHKTSKTTPKHNHNQIIDQNQIVEDDSKKKNNPQPTIPKETKGNMSTGPEDEEEKKQEKELLALIETDKMTKQLSKLLILGRLKESLIYMDQIKDLLEKPKTSLTFDSFKKGYLQLISSIIDDNNVDSNLSLKFWLFSLLILTEAVCFDKNQKWNFVGGNVGNWTFFMNDFKKSLEKMEVDYWRNILEHKQARFMEILGIENKNQLSQNSDSLLISQLLEKVKDALREEEYICVTDLQCSVKGAKKTAGTKKTVKEGYKLYRKFRIDNLLKFKEILESANPSNTKELAKWARIGRFGKDKFNQLPHSIILGTDGGIYMLMNSLSEGDYEMILEEDKDGSLREYLTRKLKKEKKKQGNEIPKPKPNKKQIVIGEGSFGRIRYGFPLIENTNSKIAFGEIICIKKTKGATVLANSDIRKCTLNDYTSDEISKYVHSPDVYDINIIIYEDEAHSKGYTMQQFKPIPDGNWFTFDPTLMTWKHQKAYFTSIFNVVLKLLENGFAMTDLKPGNTLYDKKERRAKLIDLAGVVRRRNMSELCHCKKKYIIEYTKKFTDPFIKNEENPDAKVNLVKALAYTFGTMLNELILNPKCQGSPEKCPDMDKMKFIIDSLQDMDLNKRWEIQKGLEEIQKIGEMEDETIGEDIKVFMESLKKKLIIDKQYEDFGLKFNLDDIIEMQIETYVSAVEPDDTTVLVPEDIEEVSKSLANFVERRNYDENVFLLMGSAGTGKSSILQKTYLEVVKAWKEGDSIPFFIDLATGNDLKGKWETLNELLGSKVDFQIFARHKTCSLILFLDGYDESRLKKNLVSIFLRDLGNNKNVLIVTSCRTDYLSSDNEKERIFKSDEKNAILTKKYIVPIDKSSKFDLKKFVKSFWTVKSKKTTNFLSEDEYNAQIKKMKLQEIMKTNAVASIVLEVLPQLKDLNKNFLTKFDIFRVFTKETIKKEASKIKQHLLDDIKVNFCKKIDIYEFFFNFAKELAMALHKIDKTRIDNISAPEFFQKYYNPSKDLKIQPLYNLIRILSLTHVIVKEHDKEKNIEQKKLLLGFPHDNFKNYYLLEILEEEFNSKKYSVLESRYFVHDETLLKFLAEFFSMERKYVKYLKETVLRTRGKKSCEVFCAASNAISLLNAAHVTFIGENLSKLVIRNANLRDGVFTECDFTETDLSGSNLINCKLDKAIFNKSIMKDVKLKNYHQIVKTEDNVQCMIIFEVNSSPNYDKKQTQIEMKSKKSDCIMNSFADESIKNNYLMATGLKNGVVFYEIVDNRIKLPHKFQLKADDRKINAIAISPDASFFLSSSKNIVDLWDVNSQKKVRELPMKSTVKSLCFSKSGKEFLCGYSLEGDHSFGNIEARNINLIDLEGNIVRSFVGHNDSVKTIVLYSDGSKFLSGSEDASIRLWNIENGERVMVFEVNSKIQGEKSVNCVSISLDSKKIVGAYQDSKIILWCATSGKKLKEFIGHKGPVNSVCFSGDGLSIISGSNDNTVRLWNNETAKCLKVFDGHKKSVQTVCFSPDSLTLISTGFDESIILWDLEPGRSLKYYEGHSNFITSIVFSPTEEKNFLTGSGDSFIRLWCSDSGKTLRVYSGHEDPVNSICFSPKGNVFASASDDKSVILWDYCNGAIIWKASHHRYWVTSVSFSPDGKFILSGSFDKSMILMNPDNGSIVKQLKVFEKPLNCLAFLKNGQEVLAASDCFLFLYEAKEFELKKKFVGHSDVVKTFALSSNCEKIASGSFDKTIRIWDKKTGLVLKTLSGHTDWIMSVSFSVSNDFIFSGSKDNSMRLWNSDSATTLLTLEGGNSAIRAICMSKDGKQIVKGATNHLLHIYRKKEGTKNQEWNLSLIIADKETPFSSNMIVLKNCIELSTDNEMFLTSTEKINKLEIDEIK